MIRALMAVLITLAALTAAHAQEQSSAELAKKLQNPVANLISVPIQSNWDFGVGHRDAMRYTLNVQPVIPFSLTKDWNLITRTIVPFIHAEATVAGGEAHGGIGDIVQSFFLSPADPIGGWIVGGGPVFLYPSASDKALGGEQWGAGPTAVVLRQDSGFTYGILANHIWSFAGNDKRDDVNATFLQPFLTYTTKTFTTFGINTESTYDWEHSQWTVPVNVTVSQLLRLGLLPIQFTLGGRYYAVRPQGGGIDSAIRRAPRSRSPNHGGSSRTKRGRRTSAPPRLTSTESDWSSNITADLEATWWS